MNRLLTALVFGLSLTAHVTADFLPQELAAAEKIAADTDPDPYQLGKGTPAEFISNRFYLLRTARWTVRSKESHGGYSYSEAVRLLADFAKDLERGRQWRLPNRSITVPRLSQVPILDGKLSSQEWQEAYCFTGEYRLGSSEKDLAYADSIWYIGHTQEALYIAAKFLDRKIVSYSGTRLGEPRPIYEGDAFEVFIRPDLNKLYYQETQVNPQGKSWELCHKASPFGLWDMLESRTKKLQNEVRVSQTSSGYQVEMKIPFCSLKSTGKLKNFSFLLARVHRKNDRTVWNASAFALLYDPHNIYGYCTAVLQE